MTNQQEKILLHWIEKICRRCDERGVKYAIFIKMNGYCNWVYDIDEFFTRIKSEETCFSSSNINIRGFHQGPADTPWKRIHYSGLGEIFWVIPVTALLDQEFHAAFDAEFEYRQFNYLFGGQ